MYEVSVGVAFGAGPGLQTIKNIRANYGPAPFNRPHRLIASSPYELPIFRRRDDFLGKVAGGWQIGANATFQDGPSLTPASYGVQFVGSHADLLGDPNLPRGERTINRWFDVSKLANPVPGQLGNAGKGVIRGSGNNKWDLVVSKLLRLGERQQLEFRAEMVNAFNHPQFDDPVVTPSENSQAGKITSASDFGFTPDRARDSAWIKIQLLVHPWVLRILPHKVQRAERRRIAAALGMLLACWSCAFGLNPTLDIAQYAHTAWRPNEGFSKGLIRSIAQTPNDWFRVACVAVFFAMLWGMYELRVRHLAYQFNMRLEERVAERTRIARDLHDTLLQSFQALLPRLQASINMFSSRPDDARRNLEQVADQVSQAIAEGRDAIQGMRISTVEKNDLAVAIRTLGEELASATTDPSLPHFTVVVEGTSRNLHPIMRDEVYRFATESLRNAFRHAAARNVEVEIRYDEKYFRLRIRDDGKGIPSDMLSGEGPEGHYGLPGMRERAKLVGGKLVIWTELGSGAEIELVIPDSTAYLKSPRPFWHFAKRSAIEAHEKETTERD